MTALKAVTTLNEPPARAALRTESHSAPKPVRLTGAGGAEFGLFCHNEHVNCSAQTGH